MKISSYILFLLLLVLNGCSNTRNIIKAGEIINYKGHYKVGSPYKVKGILYTPISYCKHFTQIGNASWYGRKDNFHGKLTANGDIFNYAYLTAAHPTLPLPSLVKVTNLSNHRSLIVLVNDRGPFHDSRILDISEFGAELLGFKNKGTTRIKLEYLHNETHNLLKSLALQPKNGAKPQKHNAKIAKCSLNHYIQLLNQKHRLL